MTLLKLRIQKIMDGRVVMCLDEISCEHIPLNEFTDQASWRICRAAGFVPTLALRLVQTQEAALLTKGVSCDLHHWGEFVPAIISAIAAHLTAVCCGAPVNPRLAVKLYLGQVGPEHVLVQVGSAPLTKREQHNGIEVVTGTLGVGYTTPRHLYLDTQGSECGFVRDDAFGASDILGAFAAWQAAGETKPVVKVTQTMGPDGVLTVVFRKE